MRAEIAIAAVRKQNDTLDDTLAPQGLQEAGGVGQGEKAVLRLTYIALCSA
jgi:hypothetical protein